MSEAVRLGAPLSAHHGSCSLCIPFAHAVHFFVFLSLIISPPKIPDADEAQHRPTNLQEGSHASGPVHRRRPSPEGQNSFERLIGHCLFSWLSAGKRGPFFFFSVRGASAAFRQHRWKMLCSGQVLGHAYMDRGRGVRRPTASSTASCCLLHRQYEALALPVDL